MTSITRSMTAPRAGELQRNDWAMALTALVAILIGVVLRLAITAQTNTYAIPGSLSISYPASWLVESEAGAEFSAYNPRSGSTVANRMSLLIAPLAAGSTLSDASIGWTLDLSQNRDHFRNLAAGPVTIQGHDGVQVTYAYVADPAGNNGKQLPVVMQAIDTLLIVNSQLVMVRYAADATQFDSDLPAYESALAGLTFQGG